MPIRRPTIDRGNGEGSASTMNGLRQKSVQSQVSERGAMVARSTVESEQDGKVISLDRSWRVRDRPSDVRGHLFGTERPLDPGTRLDIGDGEVDVVESKRSMESRPPRQGPAFDQQASEPDSPHPSSSTNQQLAPGKYRIPGSGHVTS